MRASPSSSFALTSPAPVAARIPRDVSVHGDPRNDEFFWLREKENPTVRAHLEAENAHTETVLAPTQNLRATLFTEMRGRIKEDDRSVPVPYLGWRYYTRMERDRQYAIHCRQRDEEGAPEEILVDLNKLGEGKPYVALGDYVVSDDGARLAYSVDWTGYRQYEVFVLELATGRHVPHGLGLVADLAWGAGHEVLYAITENEAKRSDKLHRWNLASGEHELLHTETDELYNLEIERSRDGRYLFCTAASKVTSEVRALRADDHAGNFRVLLPRVDHHEYQANHRDDRFYFVTNREAKNFRIVTAPVADPAAWTELIPHRPNVKIEAIDLFTTHLMITVREHGLPALECHEFATGTRRRIDLPDEVYEIGPDQNWNHETDCYRYRYQSPARPLSVFAVNFHDGVSRLLKETEVPGGFRSADYQATRAWAVARDGTRIPLSVVHRRDLDRTRPQPLHLYGYGSYGISMPAAFSTNRLSLLDRGFIHVISHIRGGGELGEEWREAGRMEAKATTFTDFIDCAHWLIDEGWTTPAQLVASGGSAGGLLMGAAVNLRPDLFTAVKLDVPFVDVLNTMLDDSLPLTTEEYVEWGNPNVPAEYRWMRAYSPYDNLHRTAYPHLLANVSFFDSQVPYWEGAKYIARARAANTHPGRALLLHTNFGAGHGGASGRFDALHDVARDHAFFLAALGLVPPSVQ